MNLNDVAIYIKDGPFESDIGIVNLHQSKGSYWVAYINKNYFDSYGCVPPQKLSEFIIKRNGHRLYSEYKKQGLTIKKNSYCASYCLYNLLDKFLGIGFKFAVLYLYYQRI